jgi:hypothetical protein
MISVFVYEVVMNKFIFPAIILSSTPLLYCEESHHSNEQAIHEQYTNAKDAPGAILFTPPQGWRLVDPKELPGTIKAMVIGKGQGSVPPSISLGVDTFAGTLKDYLKKVKAINESHGDEWKDLGTIQTEAGPASLSQVDIKTQWGVVRAMHVILVKDGNTYILTTSSPKEEFSKFYPEFFKVMRSLRMNKELGINKK